MKSGKRQFRVETNHRALLVVFLNVSDQQWYFVPMDELKSVAIVLITDNPVERVEASRKKSPDQISEKTID